MNQKYIQKAITGTGIILGGLLLGQIGALILTDGEFAPEAIVTFLSTIPFIMLLVGGGYWLAKSDLSPDRYPRVLKWILAGNAFFILVFAVVAFATEDAWLVRFGILHWAISVGSGSGLLIGILEARAVENSLEIERTRIRNEELRKQNKRLGDLAGVISHDLRNPLNVAEGNVELLREDYDDNRLDTTIKMFDRMNHIIEDTLTLARSGHVIGDTDPIAVDHIAEQCWRSVETEKATLQVGKIGTIIADSDRVQHLFENLFRNAVEHGDENVTVQVGPLPDGFYVEDDGPGIAESDRNSVFEAGYSTSNSGTGFGLAIIKQIADAHGWKISITESTDGGARFEITGVEFAD